MAEKEYIRMRSEPCRCGCGGQDPHHKTHYRRVIRNIKDVSLPENPVELQYATIQRGRAKLPGKPNAPVVKESVYSNGRWTELYWRFDKETWYKE